MRSVLLALAALAVAIVLPPGAAAHSRAGWSLWGNDLVAMFRADATRSWRVMHEEWSTAKRVGRFDSLLDCEAARQSALDALRTRHPRSIEALAANRNAAMFIDRDRGQIFVHLFHCVPDDGPTR